MVNSCSLVLLSKGQPFTPCSGNTHLQLVVCPGKTTTPTLFSSSGAQNYQCKHLSCIDYSALFDAARFSPTSCDYQERARPARSFSHYLAYLSTEYPSTFPRTEFYCGGRRYQRNLFSIKFVNIFNCLPSLHKWWRYRRRKWKWKWKWKRRGEWEWEWEWEWWWWKHHGKWQHSDHCVCACVVSHSPR